MKIALDATYALDDAPSGVGVYSRETLNGLARAHPEADLLFYYRPHRYARSFQAGLPANARRKLLMEPLRPSAPLFHGLNQRLPRVRLQRAVATFHDLFVMTGEYSTPEFRARFAAQARDAAARADLIIAVSEFTRDQVVDLLGIPAARVRVIHHGVRPGVVGQAARACPAKIVLSVGAIQKRKNIARLVEAFEALTADWRLVLAGSYGYGADEVRERIESSSARARISTPGYVSDAELAGLYARAAIFAFPSLDEGFGMPVLEAMAAGVPVVTSKSSSLREVAGDAALLVDPGSTTELAHALSRLAQDEVLRLDLAARGRARALLFTWEKAVSQTWDVYLELLR